MKTTSYVCMCGRNQNWSGTDILRASSINWWEEESNIHQLCHTMEALTNLTLGSLPRVINLDEGTNRYISPLSLALGRNPNANMIYANEQETKTLEENPDFNLEDLSRVICQRWVAMSKKEQAKHFDEASRLREVHMGEEPYIRAGASGAQNFY
jgi:hypothetical protein